jgi:hypothetical protein
VVTCEQNTIDEPGEDGVYVEPSVTGAGQFKANRITGLKADFQSLVNKAGAGYKLTNSENERSSFKP